MNVTNNEQLKQSSLYRMVWRWHFYMGAYVVPFLMMLAITGLVMVYFTGFTNRLGSSAQVNPQSQALPLSKQVDFLLQQVPQVTIKEYITASDSHKPAWFVVKNGEANLAVAIDPYTGKVLEQIDKDNTIFAWANKIHGTLLVGDVGDALIEIAAGFGIMLLISGLYLHWPKNASQWGAVFFPSFRVRGRALWRNIHGSIGWWSSILLLAFFLSGLSWTGYWGGKIVQPWATFPAEKWDATPKSKHHDSLNEGGVKEVPWALEQTPMPASQHAMMMNTISVDQVAQLAKNAGFSGQYHINFPADKEGVFTLSADTMSGDLGNPTQDRTLHLDQYSGNSLADLQYKDYHWVAKLMAVGIALHQGDWGIVNAIFNMVFCLLIVLLCISGVVMWFKRRNTAQINSIGAPERIKLGRVWWLGLISIVVLSLLFPLSGLALCFVVVIDFLIVQRSKVFKNIFG